MLELKLRRSCGRVKNGADLMIELIGAPGRVGARLGTVPLSVPPAVLPNSLHLSRTRWSIPPRSLLVYSPSSFRRLQLILPAIQHHHFCFPRAFLPDPGAIGLPTSDQAGTKLISAYTPPAAESTADESDAFRQSCSVTLQVSFLGSQRCEGRLSCRGLCNDRRGVRLASAPRGWATPSGG